MDKTTIDRAIARLRQAICDARVRCCGEEDHWILAKVAVSELRLALEELDRLRSLLPPEPLPCPFCGVIPLVAQNECRDERFSDGIPRAMCTTLSCPVCGIPIKIGTWNTRKGQHE